MKKICTIAASLLVCLAVSAQSRNFNLGKWTEIHASILKELNRSYVDTLPLDRMEKEGINAMLSVLDPYTIYVPAEDNKDFEMMISNTYGGIGAVIFKPDVQGAVIDLGGELPKSFILTDWPSETTVYTSPVSSVTLGARARRGIRRKRR